MCQWFCRPHIVVPHVFLKVVGEVLDAVPPQGHNRDSWQATVQTQQGCADAHIFSPDWMGDRRRIFSNNSLAVCKNMITHCYKERDADCCPYALEQPDGFRPEFSELEC